MQLNPDSSNTPTSSVLADLRTADVLVGDLTTYKQDEHLAPRNTNMPNFSKFEVNAVNKCGFAAESASEYQTHLQPMLKTKQYLQVRKLS